MLCASLAIYEVEAFIVKLFRRYFISFCGIGFGVKISQMNPYACAKFRGSLTFVQRDTPDLLPSLYRVHHLLGWRCLPKIANAVVTTFSVYMINRPLRPGPGRYSICRPMRRIMFTIDRPEKITPAIKVIERWPSRILSVPSLSYNLLPVSSGLEVVGRAVSPSEEPGIRVIIHALSQKGYSDHGKSKSVEVPNTIPDIRRVASWLRERGK